MKVLITGSTGYIGKSLINALTKDGVDVIACSRSGEQSSQRRITSLKYSLADYQNFHLPKDVNAVVHLAAITKLDKEADLSAETEISAAKKLYEDTISMGAKFIFFSSLSAQKTVQTKYARVKLEIENYLSSQPNAYVLRLGLVYGGEPQGFYQMLLGLSEKLPLVPIFKPIPKIQTSYIGQVCASVKTILDDNAAKHKLNIITNTMAFDDFLSQTAFFKLNKSLVFFYIPKPISYLLNEVMKHSSLKPFGLDRYLALSFGYQLFESDLCQDEPIPSICRSCNVNRYLLIREAKAVLSYVYGQLPSASLIKRYVHVIETLHDGVPLYLKERLIFSPNLIKYYDNTLSRHPELFDRIVAASILIETTPEGFNEFVNCRNRTVGSSIRDIVITLFKEVIAIVTAPFFKLLYGVHPTRDKKYDI
ncbi:sugar nucleotide-binding protein [Vibrio fluvialis]|nr:sugar nucleotide-binding protein [Vibrio fluvialis]MBY7821332.1 sugar nucleotide-binding protein [Vibrio fluvialis]MBY8180427.1 sugar nucleotide-binding protein [Vibrio fluvialis]